MMTDGSHEHALAFDLAFWTGESWYVRRLPDGRYRARCDAIGLTFDGPTDPGACRAEWRFRCNALGLAKQAPPSGAINGPKGKDGTQ